MEVRKMFGVFDAGVDGMAPSVLKAVYHTEREAKDRAGAYRHTRSVWMMGPTLEGKWFMLERPHPVAVGVDFDEQVAAARKAALAKLSAEDKAALGVE